MLVPLLAVAVLAQDTPPIRVLPPVRAQGSTVAPDPLERGTWVVDEDADQVVLLRPGRDPVRVDVGRWPEQLVVDSQGRVYVSCRQDNRVVRIDVDFHLTSIPTGAEPSGLFLDEAGHQLWVGLVTERALTLIDTRTSRLLKQRPVDFEPGPLELTKEGLAVLSRQGGQLLFSAPSLEKDEDWVVQLPNSGNQLAWRGEAMARVGDDLVVVHTEIDPGLARPAVSGTYGGGGSFSAPVASAVTVVRDGKVVQRLPVHSLSSVTSIAVSGSKIAFASRGNAMVVIADYPISGSVPVVSLFAGEGLSGVAFDSEKRVLALASFDRAVLTLAPEPLTSDGATWAEAQLIAAARKAHPGVASRVGRRIVAEDGRVVKAASPFFAGGQRLAVADYEPLPEVHLDRELALGRRLFFDTTDPRVSGAGLACVSCHPDGRQDGVVWRLNGSRRQTMLLAGRLAGTAPYNWKGTTRSLEDNIAQTTVRLGGTGLSKGEQHALARFLVEGLRPVTLPAAEDSALVERGRELFHDEGVGCASCHPSDAAFTDGQTHDVESVRRAEGEELVEHAARQAAAQADVTAGRSFGTGLSMSGLGGVGGLGGSSGLLLSVSTAPRRSATRLPARTLAPRPNAVQAVKPEPAGDPKDHSFDTPSLRSLAVSAPYMHDGVYPTLERLLEDNHDRMGTTSELSAEDRAALAAYLRTL